MNESLNHTAHRMNDQKNLNLVIEGLRAVNSKKKKGKTAILIFIILTKKVPAVAVTLLG